MLNYQKLFRITSKVSYKPVLQKLYVENSFVFATDSFKAVKLKTEYELDQKGFITLEDATDATTKQKQYKVSVLPMLTEDEDYHPGVKIDSIIPTDVIAEVTVNRKYLIDLLEAMQKTENKDIHDNIKISIASAKQAIKFENGNGIGLLMPLNR